MRRATTKAPRAAVRAWEDDPKSGGKPITRTGPQLGTAPLALAITGPAVPAKLYAPGTRGFRYWTAAEALRRGLWDAMSVEVAAFHESYGDISALLAGLQLPSLRRAVLAETGARIGRSSRLSRLAEQLGWALRQILPGSAEPDCLRNAVNPFFYRAPETLPPSGPSSSLTAEPHSFSRVFTGGWFEALAGMLAVRASSPTEADLLQVSLDAGRLLVDAIPAAPIVADYGSQVAAHLIESDAELFRGR